MQSLLVILAAVTGKLSQESIRENGSDPAWVHQRSRLHLLSRSEDEVFGASSLLWSYEASGFLQYDSAAASAAQKEARIENFLIRAYQDQWNAKLGWQTVSWGETLGPSLIDVINPRDLRDPSSWIRADQKLAVPLLLVGWSRESLTVDAWGSPYAPQSLLPDEWQERPIENEDGTRAAEYGVRAGDRIAGWDMKFYAMRHRARLPVMTVAIQDAEPIIQASFPLQTAFAFTVSQAWDSTVLRAEALHSESGQRYGENLLESPRDQATVGLDGSWGDHLLWGSELRYSQQKSAESRDRHLAWIVVQGQLSLWDDRLRPLVQIMQRVQQHDACQRYEVSGTIGQGWELSATWEAFQSSGSGTFTRLQAEDRLGLKVSWGF